MNLAFIGHQLCQDHKPGPHHPECPERLFAIADRMIASGMEMLVTHYDAPEVTREQLLRVHDEDYVDFIFNAAPKAEGEVSWIDGDTSMSFGTLPAALRAAGASILGVDLVMSDKHHAAFCCVRPPGHHAERRAAMGFCFFNNIAVAAAHALEAHGLARVAIADFDVHHGNGTEDCFQGDQRVLMVGTFQHPFYPYSGTENQASNMLNVPLARGTNGEEFRHVVSDLWMPRLREFQPQMILISAGFDAHYEDEMGGMKLLEKDYAWVTEQLKQLAEQCAEGRIVSMLEGGYSLSALARSVAAHIRVLAEL